MPEGDSLHRLAAKLGPALRGRSVVRLDLPRTTLETDGATGATVTGVEARGKNLLIHLSGGGLKSDLSIHVHLAMRGRVDLVPVGATRDPRELVLVLETGEHAMLVRSAPIARLVRTRDLARDRAFRDLGPDVLGDDFDASEAIRRMRLRNDRPLGEVLLDQGAVAGIGNVWKSELCFLEKLDPFAPTAAFTDEELGRVLDRARTMMRQTVDAPRRRRPDPFAARAFRVTRDARLGEAPLCVYDRSGQPCYECGTPIESAAQGFSTPRITYVCPRCQPARGAPISPRGPIRGPRHRE
ncbi:MAG: DNA-formamidopyrimidine glycosylase family protein [Sandaracinus sp.]